MKKKKVRRQTAVAKVRWPLIIDKWMVDALRMQAERESRTMSWIVRDAIQFYLSCDGRCMRGFDTKTGKMRVGKVSAD